MDDHVTITSIGDDGVQLALIGEIDASVATEVAAHIAPLAAAHAHLEIDLGATTFIDSDGAAPLIDAAREAIERNDRLVVTGWSPATRHFRDAFIEISER